MTCLLYGKWTRDLHPPGGSKQMRTEKKKRNLRNFSGKQQMATRPGKSLCVRSETGLVNWKERHASAASWFSESDRTASVSGRPGSQLARALSIISFMPSCSSTVRSATGRHLSRLGNLKDGSTSSALDRTKPPLTLSTRSSCTQLATRRPMTLENPPAPWPPCDHGDAACNLAHIEPLSATCTDGLASGFHTLMISRQGGKLWGSRILSLLTPQRRK
jgi:hypothetical protein